MVRIRQRWAAVALGVVLGMGLVTACKKDDPAAAGGKAGEAAGPTASGDDLSLLPADSELVVGINVKQMQGSSLWKSFIEPKVMNAEAQSKVATFKAKCGFDPMSAIGSVAVGLKGLTNNQPDGVAVIHGLDKAKTLDCVDKAKDEFAKNGAEVTREGDIVLIKDKSGQPGAFSFISDSTAIAVFGSNGNAAGIKAVASGGSGLKGSASFLEMYKKVKTGDSLWMMASGKVMDKVPGSPTAAYGSLNMTDGLALDVRVRFPTPDAATQAVTMVNAQAKQATKYVDKADFTAEGNELHGSVALSSQKLAELAPMLGMFMGGMGQ